MNTVTEQYERVPLGRIRLSNTEAQKARRESFDKDKLAELAASIKTDDVVVPIIVRPYPFSEVLTYSIEDQERDLELIAGERRYLAAQLAELETIPAIVRDYSDEQAVQIQLIENLQREDLHPMHEAESYHELTSRYGRTPDEVIKEIGKSRSYFYGRLKLLALTPKCRLAFYSNKINASIALLLARIPVEKLQEEALKEVTSSDWSFRDAANVIQRRFMLRLSEAAFPVGDAKLNGAGPCGECPKRTGNQPELFGDITSADVCTDPVCFDAKTRAYGQRQIAAARDASLPVLTGKEAVEVVGGKHAVSQHSRLKGYRLVGAEEWDGSKRVKVKVPKGVEPTLLLDPESGVVHKVIANADAATKKTPARGSIGGGVNDSGKKKAAEAEAAFRRALFLKIRDKAERHVPSPRDVALLMVTELEFEGSDVTELLEGLCQPGVDDKKRKTIGDLLPKMSDAQISQLVTDLSFAKELDYSQWSGGPEPKRLLAAAKRQKIDVKALRAELAPKPKADAKKKPAKKNKPKAKARAKAA